MEGKKDTLGRIVIVGVVLWVGLKVAVFGYYWANPIESYPAPIGTQEVEVAR